MASELKQRGPRKQRDVGAGAGAGAGAEQLREIWHGLAREQHMIPPKYFYDRRGSELFEEITKLEEYYQTRTERAILVEWMPRLIPELGTASVIELGAGSGEKTRVILDALNDRDGTATYVPIDVSAAFLKDSAARIESEFEHIRVRPTVGDITQPLTFPEDIPEPRLFVFLGGTIGNFDEPAAVELLEHVRQRMGPGDRLLMGCDLIKDPTVIESAYNDSRGVTAEFNLNMLRHLNWKYGLDFDENAYRHRAIYNSDENRIEMYLDVRRHDSVTVPGHGTLEFAPGETILTEISCKYDRRRAARIFHLARLSLERFITDPADLFGLTLGAPV